MDRRTFLAGGAALGGGIALAGCADDVTSAPATTTTAPTTTAAATSTTAPLVTTTTLGYDSTTPYWLQGGFAPVADEVRLTELEVRGAIPPTLSGLCARNGSNPSSGNSPHWFFGDGMVHGIRIENGEASWYHNRYIDTPFLQDGREFGDFAAPPGSGETQSNVSMFAYGDRLLSLGEVGWPYEIDPSNLATIEPVDISGAAGSLGSNVTAHPKVDPSTGLLHFSATGSPRPISPTTSPPPMAASSS